MLEDEAELGRVQLGVHRHRREPALEEAEQDREVLEPVGHEDDHPVAGLVAPAPQAVGKRRGLRVELVVPELGRAVGERGPRGMHASRLGQERADVHDEPIR
jgi:hypothetical protein